MAIRRLDGHGTISKVKNRDLYQIQVRITVDGKKRRVTRYGKTKKEVWDKVKALKREAEAGLTPTGPETVAEYLARWYTSNDDLAPKTVHSRYVNIKRMLPIIGSIKLNGLRARHIAAMYEGLRETLSDRSVKQTHEVLRKALKDAVKEGGLLDNPIDRLVTSPTAKTREMEFLTNDEREQLLALNDKWTPLFTVLSITGIRLGEALGLAWSSVKNLDDPEKAELVVKRTLGRASLAPAGQQLQFKEPKTKKSSRRIPLEQKVVIALKRQELQAKSNPDDLVFPNGFGNPTEPSTPFHALKRSLQRIADGIDGDDEEALQRWEHLAKKLRIHDLRHTAATLMIQNRASVKDVQDILGHLTYATTMDIYVHTTPSSLRDAMERGAAPTAPLEATGT